VKSFSSFTISFSSRLIAPISANTGADAGFQPNDLVCDALDLRGGPVEGAACLPELVCDPAHFGVLFPDLGVKFSLDLGEDVNGRKGVQCGTGFICHTPNLCLNVAGTGRSAGRAVASNAVIRNRPRKNASKPLTIVQPFKDEYRHNNYDQNYRRHLSKENPDAVGVAPFAEHQSP
jgi:hypothetical protein